MIRVASEGEKSRLFLVSIAQKLNSGWMALSKKARVSSGPLTNLIALPEAVSLLADCLLDCELVATFLSSRAWCAAITTNPLLWWTRFRNQYEDWAIVQENRLGIKEGDLQRKNWQWVLRHWRELGAPPVNDSWFEQYRRWMASAMGARVAFGVINCDTKRLHCWLPTRKMTLANLEKRLERLSRDLSPVAIRNRQRRRCAFRYSISRESVDPSEFPYFVSSETRRREYRTLRSSLAQILTLSAAGTAFCVHAVVLYSDFYDAAQRRMERQHALHLCVPSTCHVPTKMTRPIEPGECTRLVDAKPFDSLQSRLCTKRVTALYLRDLYCDGVVRNPSFCPQRVYDEVLVDGRSVTRHHGRVWFLPENLRRSASEVIAQAAAATPTFPEDDDHEYRDDGIKAIKLWCLFNCRIAAMIRMEAVEASSSGHNLRITNPHCSYSVFNDEWHIPLFDALPTSVNDETPTFQLRSVFSLQQRLDVCDTCALQQTRYESPKRGQSPEKKEQQQPWRCANCYTGKQAQVPWGDPQTTSGVVRTTIRSELRHWCLAFTRVERSLCSAFRVWNKVYEPTTGNHSEHMLEPERYHGLLYCDATMNVFR